MAKVIKKGDKGSTVKIIQELLNKLLKSGLDVTSVFDDATREAVKAFQKKHNLKPVDGVIGEATGIKMNELSGDKLKGAFPTAKEAAEQKAAADKMATVDELMPHLVKELSKVNIKCDWTQTIGQDVVENFTRMWLKGDGLKRAQAAIKELWDANYRVTPKELAEDISKDAFLGNQFPLTSLRLVLLEKWGELADGLWKQCQDSASQQIFRKVFGNDNDCAVMVSERVKIALKSESVAKSSHKLFDLIRPTVINDAKLLRHAEALAKSEMKHK